MSGFWRRVTFCVALVIVFPVWFPAVVVITLAGVIYNCAMWVRTGDADRFPRWVDWIGWETEKMIKSWLGVTDGA